MKKAKITVIGAGTMGAGIAQRASQSGFAVCVMDVEDEFLMKGFTSIKKTLKKGIELGKVTLEQSKRILGNIQGTTNLEEAVRNTDLVIEAVFEDMQVKKDLFIKLDGLCEEKVIFASNTSSLSITELAKSTKREDKFAGLHFFYPSAINRLVEVIAGENTSKETTDALMKISRGLGKTPILVMDAPGFAVNRFFVPWLNEACRILEDGTTNIPTIDKAAKEAFGIGMGPFELMNATGIPIAYHSQESLHKGLGEFYKPSEKLKAQFESKEPWDMEGVVDDGLINTLRDRFYGVVFGVACQLVEENVASKGDIDRGATIGLRWAAGPFCMMNEVGIGKTYSVVNNLAIKSMDTFKVPEILKKQAESKKPWDLKIVRLTKEDNIAIITMDRPEALNALNSKVLTDLWEVIQQVKNDDDIYAVIITGEGTAFVAGADIKEMITKNPIEAREFTYLGQNVLKELENLNRPVIAAVNGVALGGGCELALACDMILASEKARLGFPEVGLGIHPGFGGTQRLPRLIGKARAKELIFTADILGAKEAEKIGLVNRVVDHEHLLDEAKKLANKIARQAPIAIRLAKSAVNKGCEMDLDTGLAYEVESVSMAFSTKDSKEGMKAFTDRRKPEFKGK
ncbi:MAG: enoyl-CoA hydratase/isomerase family protein [Thermoplasmata archaeon]|nr:MAG: enoyl-CoA hydratase/isomerase family protein [Thermoplasmata archaeon]